MLKRVFRSIFCYGVWYCGLALITVHLSGYAQTNFSGSRVPGVSSDLEKFLGGKAPAIPTGEVLFEGVVDPDDYILGPGDKLNIVFWQPTFIEYPVVVNGEGDVVVPMIGVSNVGNLTLAEARTKLESAVTSAMRFGRITVSLVQPRKFRVHVTGLVENPGTFVVDATTRVADVIEQAGGLKRERTFARGDTTSRRIGSERRIEILRPDGQREGHADLRLFQQAGITRANPRLQGGQTIHVPYAADANLHIGVFGAVHQSGLFEFAEGDRVAEALALAGDLTSQADSSQIDVVSVGGQRISVDLRGTARNAALNRTLSPGDRIYVTGFPDTSRSGSVVIRGEVPRPGGYPVISGVTTLRDVLQEAGGLLPTAAANSARLIRRVDKDLIEPEVGRVVMAGMMRLAKPAYDFDPQLASELTRWDYGTVVLDLSETSSSAIGADDIRLQDGDILEVPRTPLGVRVLGAVNHAGEVAWAADGNLNYYLRQVGGVNKMGWKNRALLVKARNGSQLRYQSSLTIDPGDVIFIPPKKDVTTWEFIKDFVAVTAQVATIALIIQNVGK
ncbi:hypothetical protein EHM69_01510 [candidate division KSB1 bacterium]|nr:MAG: hypothetical protein EHM69_01510 [candidate division KSB1 bacterium]